MNVSFKVQHNKETFFVKNPLWDLLLIPARKKKEDHFKVFWFHNFQGKKVEYFEGSKGESTVYSLKDIWIFAKS